MISQDQSIRVVLAVGLAFGLLVVPQLKSVASAQEPGDYFAMWNYYDDTPFIPKKKHSVIETEPSGWEKVGARCVNGLDHTTFNDGWVPDSEHYEPSEEGEEAECTIGGTFPD